MKTTLKGVIIDYLRGHQGWAFGGIIEDHVREVHGSKGGTTSRRLRDLEVSGFVVKQIVEFQGKRVVTYKINPTFFHSENQASLFEKDETQEASLN